MFSYVRMSSKIIVKSDDLILCRLNFFRLLRFVWAKHSWRVDKIIRNITKNLMTDPSGNQLVLFPLNLNVSLAKRRGKILETSKISACILGKSQNELFIIRSQSKTNYFRQLFTSFAFSSHLTQSALVLTQNRFTRARFFCTFCIFVIIVQSVKISR